MQFDPPQVTDGSVTTLVVQASDDLSGVGTVMGVVSNPSGSAFLPFQALSDGGPGGVFVAKIAIPAKAETGLWYVANLNIRDRANNTMEAGYTAATTPSGGTVKVVSSDSDSTAPEVRSFWVEKLSLSGGEKNSIRVEVRDDRSGVASVRGAFQSPSKSALLPFECAASADPDFWEAAISIPAGAECGQWTLQVLRAADRAGNTTVLSGSSPQMTGSGFIVASGDCGSAPPTLQRIALSPTIVSNASASEIQVTADLADDGGRVISLIGWAAGPVSTSGQKPMIAFAFSRTSNDPNAPWAGKIVVPQYTAKGTWTIELVRLQDKSLASRDYTPKDPVLAQSYFEVR